MRILQSSNIFLGRSFEGTSSPGDKLRAAIKDSFSSCIGQALERKVDLVVLPGDTFANVNISQHLIDFLIGEIKRLEKIPVVIMPGSADCYEKESFWSRWQVTPPTENMIVLSENNPKTDIPDLDTRVYGYLLSRDGGNLPSNARNDGQSKYRVAVVYDDSESTNSSGAISSYREKLLKAGFDYIALGGKNECADFVEMGMKAAYSGSPLAFSPDLKDAGFVLVVNLEKGTVKVEKARVSDITWSEIELPMETVVNAADLTAKLKEMSAPNVILNVSLTGLALLDTGINLSQVQEELENAFLHLSITDNSSLLPDNVSGIKVQEKTIMGQYLKLMIEKLNSAREPDKRNLEESLKVGYGLLSGREIW